MKIEDTTINQTFYDLKTGDVFKIEDSSSTFIKSRILITDFDGSKEIHFKGTNLETGYINDFDNNMNVKIINAKVVIE